MDPISDMLIRLKNAGTAGHEMVKLPYSKFKHEIAKVLEKEGRVAKVERKGKRVKKTLEISFPTGEKAGVITHVELYSRPSRRLYASYRQMARPPHGGVVLVSTPKGVMSSHDARKQKVGGMLIAEMW